MATNDPTAFLTDLLHSLQDYVLDSLHDFQDYTSTPKVRHWLRIIVVVAGYIMLRPAIELFFKWLFERKNSKEEEEVKKKKEEEDKQLEAEGLKKPKKDGNSLRVGAKSEADEESKKKDEVVKETNKAGGKKTAATGGNETNKKDSKVKSEEYEDSDQEDYAEKIRASGVLEWGRDARKRKQRQHAETEQQQQQKKMDEEKLLEMLDWSDDEGKK